MTTRRGPGLGWRARGAIAQRKHRLELRRRAIEYLGGNCKDCRNDDQRALQFDHAHVRRNGGYTVASYLSGSWARLKRHLDQCELVCASCHAIRTFERNERRGVAQ